MIVIAIIGALTALFAATIALVQNDIKKVLAYSTVSQLGFMFLGVGVGAFTAGFFHVFTHAFFKACLFLGAGSVIHAMHARIHDDDASQDMRNMGGLRKYMPLTFCTFARVDARDRRLPVHSRLLLEGRDPRAGARQRRPSDPYGEQLAQRGTSAPPTWLGLALYWAGHPRRDDDGVLHVPRRLPDVPRRLPRLDHRSRGSKSRPRRATTRTTRRRTTSDDHHHEEDLSQPGPPPHESPLAMTIPLVILATAAIVAGLFNPARSRCSASTSTSCRWSTGSSRCSRRREARREDARPRASRTAASSSPRSAAFSPSPSAPASRTGCTSCRRASPHAS